MATIKRAAGWVIKQPYLLIKAKEVAFDQADQSDRNSRDHQQATQQCQLHE